MSAPKWLTTPGFLGTVTQEVAQHIPLSIEGPITYVKVISGKLPPGLTLAKLISSSTTSTQVITGEAFPVITDITNQFVLRATNSDGIADATFSISVSGPVPPVWITPGGFLPIGTHNEYYTVNQEIVNYQLVAEPHLVNSSTNLLYYINDGDGQLPPGLTLSQSGQISGFISDDLSTAQESGTITGFDTENYDEYPYDFITMVNGVAQTPAFVTKTYQFNVTVSDGYSTSTQLFKILLLDHNMLKADTGFITADTNYFANISPLFTPTWLSPQHLGTRRANSYQVVELKDYDPFPELGPAVFTWNTVVNSSIQCVADTSVDPEYGRQLTNLSGTDTVYIYQATAEPQIGQYIYFPDFYTTTDDTLYQISSVRQISSTGTYALGVQYNPIETFDPVSGQVSVVYTGTTLNSTIPLGLNMFIGDLSEKPPGLNLNPKTGQLFGRIQYLPAISKDYTFTVRLTKTDQFNGDTGYADRVFTLTLEGEVELNIAWDSPKEIGPIAAGYQSELYIQAHHIGNSDEGVQYKLVSGELPPGLILNTDGSISGKIPVDELTYIDEDTFVLDEGTTTIDRQYPFVAQATDNYGLSSTFKNFYIQILDYSLTAYTNIYVQPFMSRDKRIQYSDFITDETLFDKTKIYRPYDPAFGIQYQIKLLIESGIQKLALADYVISLQQYFYNKKFYFGDVKSIPATDAAGNTIYELVYVDIIDDIQGKYQTARRVGIAVNGQITDIYPNSVSNWQYALEATPIDGQSLDVDELLRPRYMNSIQASTGAPLGFIKAVPLCYALPGYGATMVEKIKLTGFDFKLIDFEVDRIIVEDTLDNSSAKYLKFPQSTVIPNVPGKVLPDDIAGEDGTIWDFDDGNILTTE